jgi:hypothetical protein
MARTSAAGSVPYVKTRAPGLLRGADEQARGRVVVVDDRDLWPAMPPGRLLGPGQPLEQRQLRRSVALPRPVELECLVVTLVRIAAS